MWLPFMHPPLGTWPTTQACALTGIRTSDPLVHRLARNLLSHTSQGFLTFLNNKLVIVFFVSRLSPSSISAFIFFLLLEISCWLTVFSGFLAWELLQKNKPPASALCKPWFERHRISASIARRAHTCCVFVIGYLKTV